MEQHFRNYGDFDMATATATSHIRILDGVPATGRQRRQTRGQDTPYHRPNRAMRGGVAALLSAIGVVRFHLWLDRYRNTSTIESPFLVAVITAGLLTIAVAVRLNVMTTLAIASFAAGTLLECTESSPPNGSLHFKELDVPAPVGWPSHRRSG